MVFTKHHTYYNNIHYNNYCITYGYVGIYIYIYTPAKQTNRTVHDLKINY